MDEALARNLLLVEDEPITAAMERKVLEKLGYAVTVAESGEKAVALAASLPGLDLVLMDIDLGEGMDGTQAAARILGVRDLPVVFLSSHAEPEMIARTEQIASYGYVSKESGPAVLDASIRMAARLFEAKRRIQESHETLENILNTIPQSVFWKDRQGRYLGCNRVFASAIGLGDPSEVVGLTDFDLPWPREEAEAYRADDRDVIASDEPKLHIIEPLQEADGTRRWIDTSKMPLRGRDGLPFGVLGIYDDITEKLRAESRAKEGKELLQSVIDHSPYLIWAKDLEGRFLFASRTLAEFFGLGDPEELRGKRSSDFLPPEEAALHDANDRLVAERDETLAFEEHALKEDGRHVFLATKFPLHDGEGRLYAVCGASVDVTEQKEKEEELRKTRELLQTTEKLCRAGGWSLDLVNGRLAWTEGTSAIHGIDPDDHREDASSRIEASLARYDPASRERLRALFDRCVNEGQPYSLECPFTTADGRRLWVRTEGKAIRGPDGSIVRVDGNIMDLTDRRRAEEEVERQLAEKEVLLREVHHRIKNNIASIEALLSMQSREVGSPEAKEALQDAIGRVESMRALYETLLMGGGYGEGSARSYLEDVTRSSAALFPEACEVHLDLDLEDLPLSPKTLFSLGIIANELVTNIMKYAFPGRQSGQVSVRLRSGDGKARLVLRDDGTGLPPGFDPGKAGGFGLTLVNMLADQLGGSFRITPGEDGTGTESVVEFRI